MSSATYDESKGKWKAIHISDKFELVAYGDSEEEALANLERLMDILSIGDTTE